MPAAAVFLAIAMQRYQPLGKAVIAAFTLASAVTVPALKSNLAKLFVAA